MAKVRVPAVALRLVFSYRRPVMALSQLATLFILLMVKVAAPPVMAPTT